MGGGGRLLLQTMSIDARLAIRRLASHRYIGHSKFVRLSQVQYITYTLFGYLVFHCFLARQGQRSKCVGLYSSSLRWLFLLFLILKHDQPKAFILGEEQINRVKWVRVNQAWSPYQGTILNVQISMMEPCTYPHCPITRFSNAPLFSKAQIHKHVIQLHRYHLK